MKTFPLGMVLFTLLLALYKASVLSIEMGAARDTLFMLVCLDAFYLMVFILIALLQSYAALKYLRVSLWLVLVVMSAIYLLDSFVILALDDHAVLFDIGRYAQETGVVLSFFDITAYISIGLWLASLFVAPVTGPGIRKFSYSMLLILTILAGWSSAYAPEPLERYSMLMPSGVLQAFEPQQAVRAYTEEQRSFYAGLQQDTADIPSSKPDIILLVVESLSSINSRKVSGSAGLLDGFDKLAEEGVLFRNFFANHQASEGGLIALLGGYPPMHFPTASPYMFDEFSIQPSVIAEYRQQGYLTEFLTNADLGFIGLNHFLDGLGIDRSRGRDEVDAMRTARRVVQGAPSDVLLYDEAIVTIRHLSAGQQAFMLTIATTSTHLPYTHPDSGPDTPTAVWTWSMQQLTSFYRKLSDMGYFEHGILLITGDHRQMRPVSMAETTRYGDSARARVPLLVIGAAYPAGQIDDRFFQQSDLLRLLGKIQQPEARLSPQSIWVERYNRKYGRIELIDTLGVFDEADLGRHEYRLKTQGSRIEWLGEKPRFARSIETRIHSQRSLHQQIRERSQDQVVKTR